ncbi:MAG: hypothetical protein A2068_00165 [Ignavibacteria bacterium GWB2_35_6b]|nr:MAG: hypothetical protein A2068_00165 [Ignavibacteria bacterium GWB2_35_6b]
MLSHSTAYQLAAFGLGYSVTTMKDRLFSESEKPNKKALLENSIEHLKTFQQSYSFLFSEALIIPYEYSSDSQMVEYFYSLLAIAETKISDHCDKNLQIYFCAGGLMYLSDYTQVIFDKKKFKVIFYELLNELGVNISWKDITSLTSKLYCDEFTAKREAKKQILDYMFAINTNEKEYLSLFYPDITYQQMPV